MRIAIGVLAIGLTVAPAFAQTGYVSEIKNNSSTPKQAEPAAAPAKPAAGALVAAPAPADVHQNPNVLPANTEVLLRMNEDLSSKKAEVGQPFFLSVAQDVIHNGMIVIPRGSRGMGEVTWRTGKGAFGKSGKMEVEIKYIEVNGRRIPVLGKFRQEGEGNTVATIGAVILVGVFSAFVTGKSALIPRGRELPVHTVDALPFTGGAAALPTATVPATQN